MFALEIEFHDGISAPETILVRRTHAIVGSSDLAHVVIEGAASSPCELRLIRGVGREFKCQPVRRFGQESVPPPFLEGTYAGEAEIKLGDVTAHVTALDSDLGIYGEESPDQAAIRVLRAALTRPSPSFPAVAVLGSSPMVLSFHPDQPLVLGRSRRCALRLDGSAVAAEHVRVGVENGQCWIEDLGAEAGVTVGGKRVRGKRLLSSGEEVSIGNEFTFITVASPNELASLNGVVAEAKIATAPVSNYPCIFSTSDQVQPSRFILGTKGVVRVGRDPANDIWISPSHISRKHLEIQWDNHDQIFVTDFSSNGSYLWGERLPRGVAVQLSEGLSVIDLCSGIVLAVCRSQEDERQFLSNSGSTDRKGSSERRARRPSSVSVLDDVMDAQRDAFHAASSRTKSTGSRNRDLIDDEPDHLATFFGDLKGKVPDKDDRRSAFLAAEAAEEEEYTRPDASIPSFAAGVKPAGSTSEYREQTFSAFAESAGIPRKQPVQPPRSPSGSQHSLLRGASTSSGGFGAEGAASVEESAFTGASSYSNGRTEEELIAEAVSELENGPAFEPFSRQPFDERPFDDGGAREQSFRESGIEASPGLGGRSSLLRGRDAAFGPPDYSAPGPMPGLGGSGFRGATDTATGSPSQPSLIVDEDYYDEEEEESGGGGFLRLFLILLSVIFLMVAVVLTLGFLTGDYLSQLLG